MSDLVRQLIKENQRTKKTFLDLGNCGLTELPEELFTLFWLVRLNLGKYYRDADGQWIKSRFAGNSNHISGKSLSQLNQLPQLKALDLIYNRVKDISFLSTLTQLQTLDLSDNQIEDVGFLSTLTKLQTLYLSNNQIKDIRFLGTLTQLQTLYLNNNKIKDIRLLETLIRLKHLDLKSNQIRDIHLLGKLTQLQHLDLRNNQIREFPGDFLQSLPLIRTLYLSTNPIENIPKEIFYKSNENSLKEIKAYSASIAQGSFQNDEVKLIVVGNTTAGKTSLMRFVQEGWYEQSQNSTHGIALTRWPVPSSDLKVNVWDFGGQEYYHATHRLFLDDHAVYVVVWEASTNKEQIVSTDIYLSGKRYKLPLEHFSYSYWLDSVRYYAANSTVLLVQNKTDKTGIQPVPEDCYKPTYSVHPPAYHLSVNQANAYRNISSSPNWTTFQDFKANLITALQTNAATYELGKGWVVIRDAIRQEAETRRWMKYGDFDAFCQQAVAAATPPLQFDSAVEMPGLLAYLRGAASTIVYYADDTHLRNIVFLNPQWVTDTIYDILSYDIRDREVNKGEFTRAEVETVLDRKGIGGLTDTFLNLMKKDRFELIFDKPNCPGEYIAPQYLPDKFHDPKVLNQLRPESPIGFTLHYPRFMPKSIFMRFMVRYGDLVHDGYWKYGIVLGKPSQRAIIECHFSERKISVQLADGSEAKKRARDYFETLWKLSAEKPEVEVSVSESDFVPIGDLMDSINQVPKIKSKQGNWVAVEDFFHLVSKDVTIKREEPLEMTIAELATPEIFFSYAWGDEHEPGESREEIVNELYESLRNDGYQVVRDKMDLGYKGLISKFIKRIGKGDIVIVAISDKYLKSPYCMFELLEIYRNARFEKENFIKSIFPIRVESLSLNKPNVLGGYYDYWENQEKEWKELIRKHRVNRAQTDTYDKVCRIHNELGDLIGHLSDMNTLTNELLSADNFAKMKDAIKAHIESLKS